MGDDQFREKVRKVREGERELFVACCAWLLLVCESIFGWHLRLCGWVKIGREEPVASMDAGGKVIWARHNEIQTVNVKTVGEFAVSSSIPYRTPHFKL